MKIIDKDLTTGIGSLPHHNVDAALEFSFKMGLPFLPQIPIRNPWEFMIAQAIEGLPGLIVESDGNVSLNLEIWKSLSHVLDRRLNEAFQQGFEAFEPSSPTSSCWQPFLWELQERGYSKAKIQIAGPLTCQWGLRIQDGTSPDRHPELESQIFQLVLARSTAMVRRMKLNGIQPLIYIDEPGLYALSLKNPKHVFILQELKIFIQNLKKEGAQVGLHCCSNTDWSAIFPLGFDILSIDTTLSLESAFVFDQGKSLETFIRQGGILSLGVVPTGRTPYLHTLQTKQISHFIKGVFYKYWESQEKLILSTLKESIYTPACGLALQSTSDVELILDKLKEVYEHILSS